MLDVKLARLIVDDKGAKVFGGDGVGGVSTDTMTRMFTPIRADEVETGVEYLRLYTSSKNGSKKSQSVKDLSVDGNTLDNVWRGGKVTRKRDADTGVYTIYQDLHKGFVQSVLKNGAVSFKEFIAEDGHFWRGGAIQTVLRLPNVDPANVSDICKVLQSSATYTDLVCKYDTITGEHYFVDAIPRQEEDGSHSIAMILWKVGTESYVVSGRRETDFVSEEQRLYMNIPESYVTELVTELVDQDGYSLVDVNARKTSMAGIFDITVTLRTMITPPGGEDIVIGGTGGIFKTELRVLRNVEDDMVEAMVAGFMQLDLISNVRSTGGREAGFWDIMYSVLILPPPRTEYKNSQDFKEQPSIYATDWEQGMGKMKFLSTEYSFETNQREFIYDTLDKHFTSPISHDFVAGKQTRTIQVVRLITYSVSAPIAPAAPTHGEVVQLSNGIWQQTSVTTTYPWWSS